MQDYLLMLAWVTRLTMQNCFQYLAWVSWLTLQDCSFHIWYVYMINYARLFTLVGLGFEIVSWHLVFMYCDCMSWCWCEFSFTDGSLNISVWVCVIYFFKKLLILFLLMYNKVCKIWSRSDHNWSDLQETRDYPPLLKNFI